MMIPGRQRICSVIPQVQLAIKMQKIEPFLNYSKRKFLKHLEEISSTREHDSNKIVELFKIFLKNEFTSDQIKKGLIITGRTIGIIQRRRKYPGLPARSLKLTQQKINFDENVINAKIREIYKRREIPKFSRLTRGNLIFNEKLNIVEEKDIYNFMNNTRSREIVVFKFRDKHGQLFLNFFGRPRFKWKP